jgi:hypothetical protein
LRQSTSLFLWAGRIMTQWVAHAAYRVGVYASLVTDQSVAG